MYKLYAELRDAGFPQGGVGTWVNSYDMKDKAYVPHPQELYSHFIADPEGWDKMRDAMAQAWIENHSK